MAGDWIKMRSNLWDDPRITSLCELTGSLEAMVIGALYWLWSAADQHSKDGIMPGLTVKGIDRKTGVKGFGDALISIKWLADHPEGVRILHFEDHNGSSAKTRLMTAKRVAEHKANAKVTVDALPECDCCVTDSLADRDLEEEREKELNTSNPNGLDADSDAADTCPHRKIIALYHEVLPLCPRIRDWTSARATQLRARWNEDKKRQNLDWWREYFLYVGKCDFLMGKTTKPFFADLEWITKSGNFTKIREGKYENRE